MYPAALQSRLAAVCANLRPVLRLVPGEPVRDVLERIERQDPGTAAAWRRNYGNPVSWLPERDAGAVSIETAKTVNALADVLAARKLELPRYDGHLSIGFNQGGESWREEDEGGIRPSTRSVSSSW